MVIVKDILNDDFSVLNNLLNERKVLYIFYKFKDNSDWYLWLKINGDCI